jgi:hypothetical protein
LFSCKKQQVIPDDYRFLIGSWKCTDCDDATNISITDESFSLKSDFFRSFNEEIKNFEITNSLQNKYGYVWQSISLNRKKANINFSTNFSTQDTIKLRMNIDWTWAASSTYYTFKKQ